MTRYLRVGGMVVALTALLMWSGGPAAGDRLVVTTGPDTNVGRRLVVAGMVGRTDEIAGATEQQEEMAEAAAAPLATFMVDRTDDDAGATGCTAMPNDCSLRGAIIAANMTMGMDTIVLQPGATYTLSLDATAADEDTAAEDDLDVTSEITIQGNGATIRRDPTVTCTLDKNNAAGEFRIFDVHSGGNLTLQNVTVTNGCVDGLFPDGDYGGSILNYGTVTIQSSTISGNSAGVAGGSILNYGTVTITNSTLSGNSAASSGGGIFNSHTGTVTITNSTLSGNSADSGGGIFNTGTVTLTNSTFSSNSASSSGGGIRNNGTVTLTNSTLSGNSAGVAGGGIRNFGTVNIKNSIVANSPSGGNCSNLLGTFNASGVNFATDGSCSGFNQVTPAQLNLGSLADNGGPTETHALLSGSVAVDAVTDCTDLGSNPVTQDQRGVMRPIDGDGDGMARCDVGAYEAPVCTNDNVPPTITTCPGALTVGTNVGCTYVGGIGTATATDNCDPSVTITNNAPAAFPLGTTTVTWKATDDAGNMSTCMQTVTVVDDDAPQITCPGNITVGTAAPNCTAPVSYTPTATDNCPVSVTCTPPSGSTFALGTTTVNCKATDGAGNMATCTFTVTVVDDDAPQITCPANQTVQAGANCQATVSVGTATATDNCTASGSITITGTRSDGQMLTAPYPGPSGVGSRVTTITWKATDAAGNMATCMQTITVTNAAPTANAGPDQTVDEGAPVTLNGSGSSDPNAGQTLTFQWTQTGGPAVVINNANMATATFTAPEVGTLECVALTFQVKVTDPCGAMATDTVVVRVRDTLVLQDDADPTKCVVIRRDCGPTANGTYCMKVGGMTLTGPLTVSLTGNTVNAQSTAADPNVAQGSIDLGRCRGNFRLTISRNNPTVTHTIVSNVNACNDVCMCP